MNDNPHEIVCDAKPLLSHLYFYLTAGCNLRCRHCWIEPKYQNENENYPTLDFELFTSIVEQAVPLGLSGIKLTGGEPLIHPRIADILDHIREREITLTIETNGTVCTTGLAEKIQACRPMCVSVSLDGSDKETHEWMRGVEGSFDATCRGVRNLVNTGLRPQIIMSIVRRNRDQMEAVVRLAESLGASSVKFNMVQPTARGDRMSRRGETIAFEELVRIGEWVESDLAASTSVQLYYNHPVAFRPLSRMFGDQGDGCGRCGILTILGVLSDGSYALCGIGETVPELVFGHASTNRLADVWENTPVLQELREGLPQRLEGACSVCLMKGICLGSCIAQNYYSSRNLWSPFWYCEEAKKLGLFPESRLTSE
jgi:SynChlorMet cassette radical SAM/SPASM protein ScmF